MAENSSGKKTTALRYPRPTIGPDNSSAKHEADHHLRHRHQERIDEGVDEAGLELRVLEELCAAREPDELRAEQRPRV